MATLGEGVSPLFSHRASKKGDRPLQVGYRAVRARNDGLFSNVATVIGMLDEAEEQSLPPVVKFDSGPYLDPAVGDNWWEYFFEPVSDVLARDASTDHLTDAEMGRLAGGSWRFGLARSAELVAKYVRPRREIVAEVEGFLRKNFVDEYIVGVHIRGTDKQIETGLRLSDDLILNPIGGVVRQLRVPWKLLAASDEQRYIELLQRAYGSRVVSYEAIRTDDGHVPLHRNRALYGWRLGYDAVVECLLLARADYLIGSRSNLSRVARCFHPEAPYVCLNNLADEARRAAERRRITPGVRFPGGGRGQSPFFSPGVEKRGQTPTQVNGHYHDEEPSCALARSAAPMEHIVVLPYYCAAELERFSRLAGIWRRLNPGRVSYRFLLSARFDALAPPQSLVQQLSGLAPVDFFRCTTSEARFPDSASAMFFDTLEHVRRTAVRDGGFALWLEADMVPLRPGWLEDIETEWRTGRYTMLGRYMRWHGVPDHINGGACYAKDFTRIVPRNIRGGWDVTCYPLVQRFGMAKPTELIDFRYTAKSLIGPPQPTAALLHGVKDWSAVEYVERKFA